MATEQQISEIYRYTVGLFKAAPGAFLGNLEDYVDAGSSTHDMALFLADSAAFKGLTSAYSDGASDEVFVSTFLNNLLGNTVDSDTMADANEIVLGLVSESGRAATAVACIDFLATTDSADYAASTDLLNARIARAESYNNDPMSSSEPVTPLNPLGLSANIALLQNVVDPADITFNLDSATAAGADVMRITGDQSVRIDFTDPANQVTGLDISGDGAIANDGVENNIMGVAADFEIVDAYSRNPLNHFDNVNNFLGNIEFDGTGFDGDGVNTDGNIFLGGLGADIALGGIGNDFMAGGGVAAGGTDELYGGRNADFFFASLSMLSETDGNDLRIDGGQTTDDAAVAGDTAMDADWLLLEVADDEDGTVLNLTADGDNQSNGFGQTLNTGEGTAITMSEIEHVDASGNLYGFLNDIDVTIGEGAGDEHVAGEVNSAYGSTSQLQILGSGADNVFIGGYDNDNIQGNAGDDLLMGGNLGYLLNNLNNPNLLDDDGEVSIIFNGVDELIGGAGDDNIVFEADGGIIEGGAIQGIEDDAADIPNPDEGESDTLWLTDMSLGTQTAADMITDGILRFDLGVGLDNAGADGIDNFAGYGGADDVAATGNYTADQSNYIVCDDELTCGVEEIDRTQVQDMENVIATGLGNVDFLAAGTNCPDLSFENQQNFFAYEGEIGRAHV